MDLEKAYNKIDNFCCSNHNTLQGNKVRYLNNREETINMFSDYQETKDDDFCKDVNEMMDALDTIKEVVDLQKENGCPLEVVFKALKQNYAYFKFIGKVEFIVIDSTGNELLIHSNKENVGEYLHNYKKTWWLKKDRSE